MIIMEAILSALALLHGKAAQSVGRSVVRTFKRWRAAYTAWHRERRAIAELSSMSDRDLTDIGINRCEILRAVRGDTAHAYFRIRRNTHLVQNIAAEREKDHTSCDRSSTHRSATPPHAEHWAVSNRLAPRSVQFGWQGMQFDQMKRRDFITLLGGATAWPLAARGQQSKVARIGALYIGLADSESFKKELREGLRELGYVEGQNIAFEFRSAEGKLDRLPELAAELARLKVDVIVALYVPCALAAKQATRDIPIVIVAADPIETGIVASLARPGGNITGVSLMSAVLIGKCVELFRDMLTTTRQVALLTNAADPLFAKLILDQAELAGRITGIDIQPITLRGPDEELDAAFATMARGRADAVVIQGSLSTKRIADLALEHRLPTASTTRAFADAGGLMSYGADGPALFRQGAKFVRRILQGQQPNDLPIEQPTKFELTVNLKTAKAMGLTIPETFLLRADTLLE